MLTSHLCLDLPSGFFSLGSPTKTLYAFLFSVFYATCLAHTMFLNLITLTIYIDEHKIIMELLLTQFSPTSYYFLHLRFK